MDDRRLALFCLGIAIAGIIGLFLTESFMGPEKVGIGDIDSSMIGRIVEVTGSVESASESSGHYFYTIKSFESNDTIRAVMWASQAKSNDVEGIGKNSRVGAKGQVVVYRGELELILNKIWQVE